MATISPFAEGYVALIRKKGEQGAKRAMTMFIGPRAQAYHVFTIASDLEAEIRKNRHCREATVTDSLWDAAKAYMKAEKGDSRSGLKRADNELRKALGPKLLAFVFVGGALLGHRQDEKEMKKRLRNA